MVANHQGDGDQDELTLFFVTERHSINPDTRMLVVDDRLGLKTLTPL